MAAQNDSPHTILVAEDSSDDVFFLQRAFKDVCGKELIVVQDGQECIEYLSKCSDAPGANPFPDLVFLDIKMPRADGHEVLAWLGTQPSLKKIPVVVMSGSVREEDRSRSLAGGAKAYFIKPSGLEQMHEIVKECRRQWLQWRDAARIDGAARA